MQSCMYICVVLSKLAELAKFPEHHIYPNDISAIKKVYFFFWLQQNLAQNALLKRGQAEINIYRDSSAAKVIKQICSFGPFGQSGQ